MKDCPLQETHRVRARVQGDNGPDRKALPSFQILDRIDDNWDFSSLKNLVMEQLRFHAPDYNDINNPETYQIAQACQLKSYFTPEYRQILLQTAETDNEVPDEWEYNSYRGGAAMIGRSIDDYVKPHFRSRIAVLPPGEVLDWHIDTNTSYACRVTIMIHGQQEFLIKRGKEVERQVMRPREIWFNNTGYNHRVEVVGKEPRVCLLLSCHYPAIKRRVPCQS